jgi:hypothetical protein
VMIGEMPVERSPQLISLLLYLPPAHCHASAVGGRWGGRRRRRDAAPTTQEADRVRT